MKATVDESLCSGCTLCMDICPEVFGIGDDDLATVLVETVPTDMEDACRDAAEECPTEAITITETAQGEAPQIQLGAEDVTAKQVV